MMNYLWLGLIVIAVLYAGWKDIEGDKPPWQPPPPPVVVESFDAGEPWAGTELDATMNEGGENGSSLKWNFSFESPTEGAIVSEQALNPHLAIEAPKGAGSITSISVASDAAGHQMLLQFSDKDGEYFGTTTIRLAGEKKWQKIAAAPADLVALPNNPGAKADAPLTLEAVVVRRSAASADVQTGTIWIDRLALESPPAPEDHPATTWMGVLTASTAKRANAAIIDIAFPLIGVMAFWLGIMRIAEKAGMVQLLSRFLKPVMVRLFPDIPPDSDAMGSIIMNIAANMLGLGNAATPMGIKAMEEMQQYNRFRDYASNAQCMLLAINTSGVTIIPTSVIAYRVAAGSSNLMAFWPATLAASVGATIIAVAACKILEKLPIFAIPANAETRTPESEDRADA